MKKLVLKKDVIEHLSTTQTQGLKGGGTIVTNPGGGTIILTDNCKPTVLPSQFGNCGGGDSNNNLCYDTELPQCVVGTVPGVTYAPMDTCGAQQSCVIDLCTPYTGWISNMVGNC